MGGRLRRETPSRFDRLLDVREDARPGKPRGDDREFQGG